MNLLSGLLLCSLSALLQAAPQDIAVSTEEIDAVLAEFESYDTPGFSLAVIHAGEIVYERGFGLASLEHRVPNGPDTVFRIGSTSKQFTAACLAMLVLRGEVDLEAEVQEYFPEMIRYPWPVRVADLVHHTSGIRDYTEIHLRGGADIRGYVDPKDSIAAVCRQASLRFEPGTEFNYSNSNYLLMGEIVHRVSGQALGEFAEEHVFGPLGMEHTHYQSDARTVVPNRAWGYEPTGGGFRLSITDWDHVGDGSVFTTVRDLARWDANFYEPILEGGQALLDLQHSLEPLADGSSTGYAFGLMVEEHRGLRRVAHAGGWVGYRADMIRFPDQRLAVICLGNRANLNPSGICMGVADLLLAELYQPVEPAPPRERPERERVETPEPPPEPGADGVAEYLGRYWSEDLQCVHSIVWREEQLQLERFGRATRLRIVEPDVFRRPGQRVLFQRDGTGAVTGFVLTSGGFGDVLFERL